MSWINQKTVNDYYPDWITGSGVCSDLARYITDCPWDYETGVRMDMSFHGTYAGYRLASKVLNQLSRENDFKERVSKLLSTKYMLNWKKLQETLQFEYIPINNYDMQEWHEDNNKNDFTPGVKRTHTTTRIQGLENEENPGDVTEYNPQVTWITTHTDKKNEGDNDNRGRLTKTEYTPRAGTIANETNATAPTENYEEESYFGFGSTNPTPVNKTTSIVNKNTQSQPIKDSGASDYRTDETSVTEIILNDIQMTDETLRSAGNENATDTTTTKYAPIRETYSDDDITGSDVTEEHYTHKAGRSGNIGVTTTQQLIQAERELWFWNFCEHVFNDIASTISIPLYN